MDKSIAVARCHEIQLAVRDREIPRFEGIPEIGMAVQLALHLRGLPPLEYEKVKYVAAAVLGIPRIAVDRIAGLLEEIGFLKIVREGKFIQTVVPTVPFFDDLYSDLGEYLETETKLSAFERLTLDIVDRLAASPQNTDSLAHAIGAAGQDRKVFDDSIEIGTKGSFVIERRSRSKSILLNPTYFSENAEVFVDHVAKCGADSVNRLLQLVRQAQGWPLPLIEKQGEINGTKVTPEHIQLLKRLAQDGTVKPPMISTSYAGDSVFVFTPAPGFVNVSPLKREQHERSLAIVSAIRQGQLLPNNYKIRSPSAVIRKLASELELAPTSDYGQQYRNLVLMRVAKLERVGGNFQQLKIIDTPENREALKLAQDMILGNASAGSMALDNEAIQAMTGNQEYTESLVSARKLRDRETIKLDRESTHEIEQLLLEGF